MDECFTAREQLEGRRFTLGFYWTPIEKLPHIELYPPQAAKYLASPREPGKVEQFVYEE